MRSSAIFGLLSLVLPFAVANPHGLQGGRRHQELANRARGEVQLHKRYDGARFTFYAVGLGACGQTNVPSDFIVALNTPQYGGGYPGPECFKQITIEYNGKTAQATIMDECPGCPYGGLDFSEGLFDYFAAESVGVLYGTWYYSDGSGGGGGAPSSSSSQWTPPSSTWTPPSSTWTPPSTTWQPPPPSSTWTPPSSTWSPPPSSTWTPPSTTWTPPATTSTSTWSTPSSTSSSSSSVDYSSGVASGLAEPTGTVNVPIPDANDPQNLLSMNQAIVGLGALAVAGSGAPS
ncbi:hypothetical protein SERLA73DRAFT_186504 [Serpula lacrymans var. lacrymans S7.3]|uniref:Uncharacterized protein n=1 Tax=Serpula lacrymans var. lacrymans (strain S7.3) TaxID=936435 RepID=F8Q7D7_SERL3|nr:hypothetical protein SERLA73DRAFT_186504 [Serpula lacrymans var. lacrymans S7.3]